ncbi:MAG: hypothetical protein FWF51_13175 [Chitinivibrionia bacterium]|nr:hypothetical protein [Chitinivibrionia bacterium]
MEKSIFATILAGILLFVAGCYTYVNFPIIPIIEKNFNGYEQVEPIPNAEEVKIYKYSSKDEVPKFIYEKTKLLGESSWKDALVPNEQDMIDIRQYAKNIGSDVVFFVYSPNKIYTGTTYKVSDYGKVNSYDNYRYENFWYIGFRKTIENTAINKTNALNGIYVHEVDGVLTDILTFDNGSFEFMESVRGTYTTSGTTLTLKMTHIYDDGKWNTIDAIHSRTATYSISGNTLILTFEDDPEPLVLVKIKVQDKLGINYFMLNLWRTE